MQINLRRAEAADCRAVNDFMTALVRFAADRRATFGAALAHPDHDLIVAESAGEVLGLAHLLTYHDLAHGALSGELLGLVVREDYRRQGIARALLGEIMELARKRGVCEFHINTESDNIAAQRLYQSMGARIIAVQMEVDVASEAEGGSC